MKYRICVSIPFKFQSFMDSKLVIDNAIKSDPNLIELRFDYISNAKIINPDFLKELLTYISPHHDVIFTFRDLSHGGQIEIEPEEHFKITKMFIDTKPDYIDVEMNTREDMLEKIIYLASEKSIKLIISYHSIVKTLTYNEAINLINDFQKKFLSKFSIKPEIFNDFIYKIVFPAQTFEDNLIALKLCKNLSNSNQKIISFCSGIQGIISRILCIEAGSFMTYCSLEEETAPGQINIYRMRDFYNLIPK
ncbi:MAG: type I 3-dehydroquinate dehydratase [Candidatus Thorarchaeota archaeon]